MIHITRWCPDCGVEVTLSTRRPKRRGRMLLTDLKCHCGRTFKYAWRTDTT